MARLNCFTRPDKVSLAKGPSKCMKNFKNPNIFCLPVTVAY